MLFQLMDIHKHINFTCTCTLEIKKIGLIIQCICKLNILRFHVYTIAPIINALKSNHKRYIFRFCWYSAAPIDQRNLVSTQIDYSSLPMLFLFASPQCIYMPIYSDYPNPNEISTIIMLSPPKC